MRSTLPRLHALVAIQILTAVPLLHAQILDSAPHPPPDYDTMAPPGVGGSYQDPVFGTEIWRLSNAPQSSNAADGGTLSFVMNEYATMSAFSHDGSRLILQHDSYFGLYDADGRFLGNLPFEVHAGSEPRWSRTQLRTLYYFWANQLRALDVDSGDITVVHEFTEYSSVAGNGESSLCFDGEHMVIVGDGRSVLVYDLATDTAGPALDAESGFDAVYMTPDDHVTITWYDSGTGPRRGIELYDRNLQLLRQLTRAGGHMDVTRNAQGEEVLVWINSADPQPICDNGLVEVRMSDGQQTCLASLDWSLAVHVSCPDGDGSCLIGTYAPADPDPSGLWPAYTNELFQVLLDGSGTQRLAHSRSRPHNGYNYMPRASVSRDGTRAVFSSNFNLQATGASADYSDAYLMELPSPTSGGGGSSSGGGTAGGGESGGDGETGSGDTGGGSAGTGGSSSWSEEDGGSVTLTGSWFDNELSIHSGGTAVLAIDPGSRATFSFRGIGASWIGFRDEWSGIANVYVDGNLIETVDTWASPQQSQASLFTVSGLPDGDHTLAIEVTGTVGPQSAGAWVWVDAFEAIGSTEEPGDDPDPAADGGEGDSDNGGGTTVQSSWIEEDDAAVQRIGDWFPNQSPTASGGGAILAMDPGTRIMLPFRGTGVRWIGHRDEWSGIAHVRIDGELVATIDTWSARQLTQTEIASIDGLALADHVLEIEVVGETGPQSAGAWVWVDAFEVTTATEHKRSRGRHSRGERLVTD